MTRCTHPPSLTQLWRWTAFDCGSKSPSDCIKAGEAWSHHWRGKMYQLESASGSSGGDGLCVIVDSQTLAVLLSDAPCDPNAAHANATLQIVAAEPQVGSAFYINKR